MYYAELNVELTGIFLPRSDHVFLGGRALSFAQLTVSAHYLVHSKIWLE